MFSLLMIGGLIFLIAAKDSGFFWPDVCRLKLKDGTSVGRNYGHEKAKGYNAADDALPFTRTRSR
jgi:ABC-type phosphate transport system auxiliary subunit